MPRMVIAYIRRSLKSWEWMTWVAAAFELAGLYLLGNKMPVGFLVSVIGGVFWITYALLSKNTYGLVGVCSVAIILNMRGFINWN